MRPSNGSSARTETRDYLVPSGLLIRRGSGSIHCPLTRTTHVPVSLPSVWVACPSTRTGGALENFCPLVKIARSEERVAQQAQGIYRTYAQATRRQSYGEVAERLE